MLRSALLLLLLTACADRIPSDESTPDEPAASTIKYPKCVHDEERTPDVETCEGCASCCLDSYPDGADSACVTECVKTYSPSGDGCHP